ncbi:PREDICTED: cytochrome P450 4C1-like [Papilio polytes]|uniref:cytochrome P450 4C1-like n=1 Tax=Papilio polytes TaxID=76194 RepID=UPI000676ACE2|nr:PREDICTED: cytochrome P450 4C1-like [Papilio polytes]
MLWLLLCFTAGLLALIIYYKVDKNEDFDKIPGPKGLFLLHNTLDFLEGPVFAFYYFRQLTQKYKQLFKLQIGNKKIVAIYNPEDAETILSDMKYITKGYPYKFIKPWMVEGLALSTGAKWAFRRKLLTPAFYFNILKIYKIILEENSRKLVENLKCEVGQPKTDVEHYLQNFTLNSICETAMGIKLDEESKDFAKEYKQGVFDLSNLAIVRTLKLWMHSDFIFSLTELGRKQKRTLQMMNKFRDRVIDTRRETFKEDDLIIEDEDVSFKGKKRLAMLDLLLQAEKQGTIDADGIKEEVDTFMFGGHDTSATALQYALMVFANNLDAQERVIQEYNEFFSPTDQSIPLTDLGKLKYLDCCVKECLRLYPSVPVILRNIEHSVKLKDNVMPAGTQCIILIYDLHRREDQFPNPNEFQPERFMTNNPTWHPYAYVPFSAGPRNCIGQKFALIEMKLAILAILRQYRLLPVTKPEDIAYTSDLMLRSTEPVYVKIEERT